MNAGGDKYFQNCTFYYGPQADGGLRLCITLEFAPNLIVSGENHMATTMSVTQNANALIAPKDIKGNPAKVDGLPEWTNSDDTKVTMTVAADAMSAHFAPVGPVGNAQITIKTDADLGEGVVPLVGTIDFEIVAGQAINLGVDVKVEDQTPPAPLAKKK